MSTSVCTTRPRTRPGRNSVFNTIARAVAIKTESEPRVTISVDGSGLPALSITSRRTTTPSLPSSGYLSGGASTISGRSSASFMPNTRAGEGGGGTNGVGPHAVAASTRPIAGIALMPILRLQRRNLSQQLGVLAPGPELRLDVLPAQHTVPIHQEIRALGEEPLFEQHAVGPAYVASEVAEQILAHRVLGFVFPERRHGIDAHGKHGRARALEGVVVRTEGAILGGARAREREGKKGDQHMRAAPECRKRDVSPGGGREREIGGSGADAELGRASGHGHNRFLLESAPGRNGASPRGVSNSTQCHRESLGGQPTRVAV